ncbi:MAG: restriction endonuclease [Candidatus Thorarchaeota archaeon]
MADQRDLKGEFEKIKDFDPIERGYALEKLLGSIFDEEGIEHGLPYKPRGEQIDGWIFYHGRTFLVEAKWTKKETSASSIYEFRGKLEGKLSGTLGIFLSMSGFSTDCVETVRAGKMLNVLLFDRSDFEAVVQNEIKFSELLRSKMRTASTTGVIYYPWSEMKRVEQLLPGERISVLIVGEGPTDVTILKSLVSFAKEEYGLNNLSPIYFSPGGKQSLLNTFPVLVERFKQTSLSAFIAVIDMDSDRIDSVRVMRKNIRAQFEEAGYDEVFHLAVADPCIEAWLGIDRHPTLQELENFLENYDWQEIIQDDVELRSLVDFLRRKASLSA